MKKDEVGLLHFSAQINGEEAVMIRLYRDGSFMRDGGGGLPPILVQGQFRGRDNNTFKQLLEVIPDQFLEKPAVWQAPSPISLPVDYKILCYGLNRNGGIGMEADWGDMCGLRVVFDLQNPPPNALVQLADKLVNAAKVVTNRTYFDILVKGATGYHSNSLPENTSLAALQDNQAWLEKALARFVIQVQQLHPTIKVEDFPKGKFYKDPDGRSHLMVVSFQQNKFSYRFIPA